MKALKIYGVIAVLGCLVLAATARAEGNRLQLGAGIITLSNPNETDLEVSAEFEHRYGEFTGLGGMVSYIFSGSGITLVGLPEGFFHPLGGDWIIYGTPLFEFGSQGSHLGVRLGTRVPIPTGSPVTLIPELAVDFINGGNDVLLGLGIAF